MMSGQGCGLVSWFTFGSFVVGDSNRQAYEAALMVAEKPGEDFNPLIIVGEYGLGKTHLSNAIGNRLKETRFPTGVYRLSTEAFVDQLIESIRSMKTEEFRKRFRDECNVLIVEDIQFLSDRPRTMGEFFHTLEKLHDRNRQVVLTCRRRPNEPADLASRLAGMFQRGLVIDILPPDFDLRREILRRRIEEFGLETAKGALGLLASLETKSVGELEGLVNVLRSCTA
jgi:chromosomal replication initiator protein